MEINSMETGTKEISTMEINKGNVISFQYVLSTEDGEEVERSEPGEPRVYLHGYRNMLQGVEEALLGKKEGDEITVTLPPERGYGIRKNDSIQRVPIKHLLDKVKRLKPGMSVKVNTKEGARDVVIVKVGKFNVDVDTNHPLAGKTVTFDIVIESIREGTLEEKAHGHSHGPEGHGHH
jgi:FKBP-type peptidyl-prolyl cis-trans isomerase SlyD